MPLNDHRTIKMPIIVISKTQESLFEAIKQSNQTLDYSNNVWALPGI